jgi:hypothetical protein
VIQAGSAVDAEARQLDGGWRDAVDDLATWERELVPADLEAVGASKIRR